VKEFKLGVTQPPRVLDGTLFNQHLWWIVRQIGEYFHSLYAKGGEKKLFWSFAPHYGTKLQKEQNSPRLTKAPCKGEGGVGERECDCPGIKVLPLLRECRIPAWKCSETQPAF